LTHEVASSELRNNTRGLLRRVEAGEDITITVGGRPVASLRPIPVQPRAMARADFIRTVLAVQADSALTDDLRTWAPDTTDDQPPD